MARAVDAPEQGMIAMMYDWGWGGGLVWMFGGLLVLIGVVVLVAWILTTLTRPSHDVTREPSRPTPNEILRERFARGEITEQEFEQAKRVLGPDR